MTSVQQPLQDQVAEALFRSSLYQGLALGFAPPLPLNRQQLRTRWGELLDAPMAWPHGVKYPLVRAAENLLETPPDELMAEYWRLFDPETGASLRESSYTDQLPNVCLDDLGEYYQAFGMEGTPHLDEIPDTVGRELDFMSALAVKEAFALSREWYVQLDLTLDAQAKFMKQHLGAWVKRCLTALREHHSHPFYLYLGEATLFMLEHDARRLNATR